MLGEPEGLDELVDVVRRYVGPQNNFDAAPHERSLTALRRQHRV